MYDRYFGLKQKPFKSNVVASDVFVGAEAKRLLKCLDSAFSYEDAVFLVTGPSGVGKSTLTKWALQEHSAKALLIRLPRARLSHDEVLDFLLDKLGATAVPTGMLRKLILCKKLIADLNKVGTPLAVLVEDATRVGEDGLVELENLTAADADEGSGARLVLLGNDNLAVSLRAAALARLRQRV
ncbi:MAG TPA: AAA family ATPase, partial [Woeseiaceae bacterium]|nr:AAA family ATPase [Woeseiaceae bacterium]